MTLDPGIVMAILAIFGVGVIGIVQTLKRLLKLDGLGAILATFVVSFAATAVYLVQTHAFAIPLLLLYGAVVFGEASGLYHVIKTQT
jgi:hypothetical protein